MEDQPTYKTPATVLTKATIESYHFTDPKGNTATINIYTMGLPGRIQIASTFGNWQQEWWNYGYSFKKFLIDLKKSTLAAKLGLDNHFDLNASASLLRLKVARYDFKDQELKRSLLDWIDSELRLSSGEEDYLKKVCQNVHLMRVQKDCPELSFTFHPLFVRFWNELWPTFIARLREEIAPVVDT